MEIPIVAPSGSALATASVPRLPLAPGLFSITNGLSELLLQAVRDQPRHHVRRGARPERHHDLDALRRPLLRRGSGRDEQRCRQCDGQSSLHRVSRAFGDAINK
jgi:hypothetical protein